jgi:hypothetical protein
VALTGGDEAFAGDYTSELQGMDRTLSTTNLDQPATANGLIDYLGGIFTEDLMSFKDGKQRYTASSLPTIAFHGTDDIAGYRKTPVLDNRTAYHGYFECLRLGTGFEQLSVGVH